MVAAGMEEGEADEMEGLELSSHELRSFFQRRGIHLHAAYPEYFSEEPAIAAVTYEWSPGFVGMRRFLNSDNVSDFNRNGSDPNNSHHDAIAIGDLF